MYQYLKNSLAFHKARPFVVAFSIANTPLPQVGQAMKQFDVTGKSKRHPEAEAVAFYLLNDAFAKLSAKFDPNEPLPEAEDEIANMYIERGYEIALRAAYYTLGIITREARHMHHSGHDSSNSKFLESLKSTHGKEFYDFMAHITGEGESSALQHLKENQMKMSLGEYVTGLTHVFNNGPFSSSYGGPKWGNVAEQLRRVVHGEISFEVFTDVVWTLVHNGGPIFNKGFYYHDYDGGWLQKILDVQRSGQIPQLVEESSSTNSMVHAFYDLQQNMKQTLGPDFGGYVDWFKVEALGSISKYPLEKQAQVSKYGAPSHQLPAVDVSKRFYVTPHAFAKIVPRKKAA